MMNRLKHNMTLLHAIYLDDGKWQLAASSKQNV